MHRPAFPPVLAILAILTAVFAAQPLQAAETVAIDLTVASGTTSTQTVVLRNHGGTLVRLWSDNDLSTASLSLEMANYPQAPAIHTATLPTTQTAWLSPNVPLPNALSLQATLEDAPTTTSVLGILMLIERP